MVSGKIVLKQTWNIKNSCVELIVVQLHYKIRKNRPLLWILEKFSSSKVN